MADPTLTLHQLFSPAFPVGAFAYSHGLESAVQDGRVTNAGLLQEWLEVVLTHGAGWSDAVMMSLVAQGGDAGELAELAGALSPSSERRLETVQQGEAFASTVSAVWGVQIAPAPYPVAAGQAVAALSLPLEPALRIYLQAFAANIVSAGVRLIPLGQTEGQATLQALTPLCEDLARRAMMATEADLGGFAPIVDVAGQRHGALYSKLFRS